MFGVQLGSLEKKNAAGTSPYRTGSYVPGGFVRGVFVRGVDVRTPYLGVPWALSAQSVSVCLFVFFKLW